MSSETNSAVPSLRLKLTRILLTVFLFSLLLTFGLGVLITYNSLKETNRREIASKTVELAATYAQKGVRELQNVVESDNMMGRDRPFFVRLADARNNTLFASTPQEWTRFGVLNLEKREPASHGSFFVLGAPGAEYSLEVFTYELGNEHILQVGSSTRVRDHVVTAMIRTFLLITIPAAIALVLFLWWFSRSLMKPVTDLLEAAHNVIDNGHYEDNLPQRGIAKEFDEVAALFNRMFSTLEGLIGNLRRALTSIGHEIRTPMTRLRMNAEFALREEAGEEERIAALEASIRESENVTALLKRILETSEAESGLVHVQRKAADLAHMCSEVAELYGYMGAEREIEVQYRGPDSLVIGVDPERIRQVLTNLLDNALKYSEAGSTVLVELQEEENTTRISVEDEGPGVAEEDIEKIWNYGFRSFTPSDTKGHGLGLTLVKAIVEAHGGSVEARSEPQRGTCFIISLPRSGPQRSAEEEASG